MQCCLRAHNPALSSPDSSRHPPQDRAHAAALGAELLGAFTAVRGSLGLADGAGSAAAAVNATVARVLGNSTELFTPATSGGGSRGVEGTEAAPPVVAFEVCRALFPDGLPLPPAAAAPHEAAASLLSQRLREVERGVAGCVALLFLLGPWLFWRSADRLKIDGQPLSKLLAYRLDIWFSTHSQSKVIVLLMLTTCLVLAGSAGLLCASGEPLYDELWTALAGAGIDWQFAGETHRSTPERVVAALISVGGMLITALMLGIVSDTIGNRMDELRKGRSEVLEKDHVLILGWSDKLLPLVRELWLSHQTGGGTIVILAERPKEDMDGEVQYYLEGSHEHGAEASGGQHDRCKVECRKGSPVMVKDLMKVSVHKAAGIIVLHEGGDDEESGDAKMLRVVLALTSIRERYAAPEGMGHIVVEVQNLHNRNLVALLGGTHVEMVVSRDFVGRLMLVCARQPGLAFVFEDLLGFQGSEVAGWPRLGRAAAVVAAERKACLAFPRS